MTVLMPIVLSFFLPLLLWLGGRLKIAPNLRFKAAVLIVFIVWTFVCILKPEGSAIDIGSHWLAGMLFMSAVALLGFMPWSVFCWGYTLSMLLRLAECEQVNGQEDWAKQYAGPLGISQLSKNRVTVLVGLRFAYIEENQLFLTSYGRFSADILHGVSRFFGISR